MIVEGTTTATFHNTYKGHYFEDLSHAQERDYFGMQAAAYAVCMQSIDTRADRYINNLNKKYLHIDSIQ